MRKRTKLQPPDVREKIGYMVRYARTQKNKTQPDICKRTGLKSPEISATENGSNKASARTIEITLGTLGISPTIARQPSCYSALSESIVYNTLINDLHVPVPAIRAMCFIFDAHFALLSKFDREKIEAHVSSQYPDVIVRMLEVLTAEQLTGLFQEALDVGVKMEQGFYPRLRHSDPLAGCFSLLSERKPAGPLIVLCRHNGIFLADLFGIMDRIERIIDKINFTSLHDTARYLKELKTFLNDIEAIPETIDNAAKIDKLIIGELNFSHYFGGTYNE